MTATSANRVYLASLRFAQIPRLRLRTSDTLKTLYAKHLKQEIHKIKQTPLLRPRGCLGLSVRAWTGWGFEIIRGEYVRKKPRFKKSEMHGDLPSGTVVSASRQHADCVVLK